MQAMNRSPLTLSGHCRRATLVILLGFMTGLSACGPRVSAASPATDRANGATQEFPMKIQMDVDGRIVTGMLDDTPAGRDFAALLPLSVTLKDYAGIERIADLPRKLSVADAPAGVAPKLGDIAYYAPWGNLAIFVGDNVYARGLVRLGTIESGLPALQRPGPLKVRIERVEE